MCNIHSPMNKKKKKERKELLSVDETHYLFLKDYIRKFTKQNHFIVTYVLEI